MRFCFDCAGRHSPGPPSPSSLEPPALPLPTVASSPAWTAAVSLVLLRTLAAHVSVTQSAAQAVQSSIAPSWFPTDWPLARGGEMMVIFSWVHSELRSCSSHNWCPVSNAGGGSLREGAEWDSGREMGHRGESVGKGTLRGNLHRLIRG